MVAFSFNGRRMMNGVEQRSRLPKGGRDRARKSLRMAHILAAGCLVLVFPHTAVFPARAQTAPGGMVRYDHPVYHHGRRVLWHGVGRGGRDSDATSHAEGNEADGRRTQPRRASNTRYTQTATTPAECAWRMT